MRFFAFAAILVLVALIGAFVAFAFYDVPVAQTLIVKEIAHG